MLCRPAGISFLASLRSASGLMGVKPVGWIGFLCRGFSIPQNFGKSFTMRSPRIYTYKVTFEEIPHWYWGVHKEKKHGELYLGSPTTHKWMWEFYTPRVHILELFPYTPEGWKVANDVEDRLIMPDLNNPLCLNEGCNLFCSTEAARKGGISSGNGNATLGRGFCNPDFRGSEKWKETHDRIGAENVRLGRGVFDPDYINSEKRKETQKRIGALIVEKRLGILSHDYMSSEEYVKTRSDNMSKLNKNLYEDPDHPELGRHSPGTLTQMQKRRGYPHGKEYRVRVY